MKTESKIQRWYSKRAIADRYGVHPRSIERWRDSGKFPPGTQINKRWYWTDAEIEAHERALIKSASAVAAE